jgi:predicted DNA-binding ribbon-helix-helix protein
MRATRLKNRSVRSAATGKRSILLHGRKTSASLEDEFWAALREIARHDNVPLYTLIEQIYDARESDNLSSAIRLFVLNRVRSR